MATIKISMTYDRTTPESAEQGDHSDHGWYEPGGWYFSICDEHYQALEAKVGRQQALADMTPDPAVFDSAEYEDLAELIEAAADYMCDKGGLETSGYPYQPGDWYTTVDPDVDYSTGEETRHSFHVEADPDLQLELHAELKRRGMLL